MVHGIAVALIGYEGCRRDGGRGDGFDARHEPTDRLTDDDGLLVDEVEKRDHVGLGLVLHGRDDADAVVALLGELSFDIK